jgi:methionyl-tRNA synthetase
MYTLAEGLRQAAVMLYPFMPTVAEKIAYQLGWTKPLWTWPSTAWGILNPGSVLQPEGPIFPRIMEKTNMTETFENPVIAQPTPAPVLLDTPPAPPSELITIDDFAKVQFKVGVIVAAEKHPKADKLLKLQVDLGEAEPRQIIAGIALVYPPETLVGRQVVVVANLQPAKLRGEMSHGMLLAADMGEHGMSLLKPDNEDVPRGSKVR